MLKLDWLSAKSNNNKTGGEKQENVTYRCICYKIDSMSSLEKYKIHILTTYVLVKGFEGLSP